jgi:hypothetical protein
MDNKAAQERASVRYTTDPEYRERRDRQFREEDARRINRQEQEAEVEREQAKRDLAAYARLSGWSNKRAASCIRRRLDALAVSYVESGAPSIYFKISINDDADSLELRIADHAQPAGGGYAGDIQHVGDTRHGDSDILCDPWNLDWRAAWEEVKKCLV